MAGCLLRDDRLVEWALYGKSGFDYQLQRSLMATGMWYEESPVYHWYALRAHVQLLEAASRAGVPLYDHPRVRGMFEAPLRIVLPDGTVPPLNDSDSFPMAQQSWAYDIAYRRYGADEFAAWAVPRDSDYALLWGADDIVGAPSAAVPQSSNSRSEGLGILRNPENTVVAMLEYGPGLSGHVHPAKLNLAVYGLGGMFLIDPGRISYGNDLQKEWYTQTLAHNAIVVNEASQRRTRGSLRAFAASPAVVRAVCETAYTTTVLDRTILLHENLVFDLVRCSTKHRAVFDVPHHIKAAWLEPPSGAGADTLGTSEGYQHLRNIINVDRAPRLLGMVAPSGRELRVHVAATGALFSADAPGNPATERVPLLLQRHEGTTAVVATVFELEDPAFPLRTGEVTPFETDGAWGMEFGGVRLSAGAETVVEIGNQRWVIDRDGATLTAP